MTPALAPGMPVRVVRRCRRLTSRRVARVYQPGDVLTVESEVSPDLIGTPHVRCVDRLGGRVLFDAADVRPFPVPIPATEAIS